MTDLPAGSRSSRLDGALAALLGDTPELEAAAVVSFDGLPMASSLPAGMDEGRVAAMSAALLSLGERAAQGLGRGELSQVYIEGDSGTVFLVAAEDEAVLVAVAAKGAKVGMMLYEVRRTAAVIAAVLRADEPDVAFLVDTGPEDLQPEDLQPSGPPVQAVAAGLPVQAVAAGPPAQAFPLGAQRTAEPLLTVVPAAEASTPTWATYSGPSDGAWSGAGPLGSVLPVEPPRWS